MANMPPQTRHGARVFDPEDMDEHRKVLHEHGYRHQEHLNDQGVETWKHPRVGHSVLLHTGHGDWAFKHKKYDHRKPSHQQSPGIHETGSSPGMLAFHLENATEAGKENKSLSKSSDISIKREPVASSNLKSVGYHPESQTLETEFHNGAVYRHHGVSPEKHAEMMGSDSIGAYFNKHISREHEYEKIKEGGEDPRRKKKSLVKAKRTNEYDMALQARQNHYQAYHEGRESPICVGCGNEIYHKVPREAAKSMNKGYHFVPEEGDEKEAEMRDIADQAGYKQHPGFRKLLTNGPHHLEIHPEEGRVRWEHHDSTPGNHGKKTKGYDSQDLEEHLIKTHGAEKSMDFGIMDVIKASGECSNCGRKGILHTPPKPYHDMPKVCSTCRHSMFGGGGRETDEEHHAADELAMRKDEGRLRRSFEDLDIMNVIKGMRLRNIGDRLASAGVSVEEGAQHVMDKVDAGADKASSFVGQVGRGIANKIRKPKAPVADEEKSLADLDIMDVIKAKKENKHDKKMHKVMHEFYKDDDLHSGSKHGPKVTSRKQAVAIGLSEARKAAAGHTKKSFDATFGPGAEAGLAGQRGVGSCGCGSPDSIVTGMVGGRAQYHCNNCGHVFLGQPHPAMLPDPVLGGMWNNEDDPNYLFETVHRSLEGLGIMDVIEKAKSMKLGHGGRAAKLKRKLTGEKGVRNPGAIIGKIGREKYGAHKMGKWAAAGRKRAKK